MERNRVEVTGRVLETGLLRHTPAGAPVTEFRIGHASRQTEGGLPRAVEFEMDCLALGAPAQRAAGLKANDGVRLAGFLANRGRGSRQLVLHVNELEIIGQEG